MTNMEMAHAMMARATPLPKKQKTQLFEYRLLFGVCFAVILWAVAIERIIPRHLRHISNPENPKSFLAEVKDAAHCCAAIAFQG